MMAIVVTGLGIAVACLAAAISRPLAWFTVGEVALLGAFFSACATAVGASRPKIAASLCQLGILLPLAVGAAAGAAGIWIVSEIGRTQGATPTAWQSAIGAAVGAMVAMIVEQARVIGAFMPASIAERYVVARYQKCFPDLSVMPSASFKLAYEAIHLERLSDSAGPLIGWGFDATARRLALIDDGLKGLPPTAACAKQAP